MNLHHDPKKTSSKPVNCTEDQKECVKISCEPLHVDVLINKLVWFVNIYFMTIFYLISKFEFCYNTLHMEILINKLIEILMYTC